MTDWPATSDTKLQQNEYKSRPLFNDSIFTSSLRRKQPNNLLEASARSRRPSFLQISSGSSHRDDALRSRPRIPHSLSNKKSGHSRSVDMGLLSTSLREHPKDYAGHWEQRLADIRSNPSHNKPYLTSQFSPGSSLYKTSCSHASSFERRRSLLSHKTDVHHLDGLLDMHNSGAISVEGPNTHQKGQEKHTFLRSYSDCSPDTGPVTARIDSDEELDYIPAPRTIESPKDILARAQARKNLRFDTEVQSLKCDIMTQGGMPSMSSENQASSFTPSEAMFPMEMETRTRISARQEKHTRERCLSMNRTPLDVTRTVATGCKQDTTRTSALEYNQHYSTKTNHTEFEDSVCQDEPSIRDFAHCATHGVHDLPLETRVHNKIIKDSPKEPKDENMRDSTTRFTSVERPLFVMAPKEIYSQLGVDTDAIVRSCSNSHLLPSKALPAALTATTTDSGCVMIVTSIFLVPVMAIMIEHISQTDIISLLQNLDKGFVEGLMICLVLSICRW